MNKLEQIKNMINAEIEKKRRLADIISDDEFCADRLSGYRSGLYKAREIIREAETGIKIL